MSELGELSKTLCVPLVGRIYAPTYYPAMITDSKALALEPSLSAEAERMRRGQSEYIMSASIARSVNMDRRIRASLVDNPHGAAINVGCEFKITFWRCGNRSALWFEPDLLEVIEIREGLLASLQRHVNLPGDMFNYSWIDQVKEYGERSTIIIASGVFYYFHEDEVVDFINHPAVLHNVCIVLDSTSLIGVKMSQYYMKRMKNPSPMHFSIDGPRAFVDALVGGVWLIEHTPYYRDTDTRGAGLGVRVSMRISDALRMVAMDTI